MVYEDILSYAKIKILKALRGRELQLSEIARIAGLSLSSTHEALKSLEVFGIVSFRKVGKTRLYTINERSFHARSIMDFLKTENKFYDILLKEFVRKTKKLPGIISINIFGSFARGKELAREIDVLVLCRSREKIKEPIRELEADILGKYDIYVSATIMEVGDFLRLFKKSDKFVLNIMGEGKNLFGKKLEAIANGKGS